MSGYTKLKTRETLIYIGGSTEASWRNSSNDYVMTLPIKEIIKGAYRGRIESDWISSSIFEEGSGENMVETLYYQ